jgi:hypothetical protein
MKTKIIITLITSLMWIGCGSSDSKTNTPTSTPTSTSTSTGNMSFQDINKEYTEVALITRATREFCDNNEIASYIKNSTQVSNYFMGGVENRILECSDLGKTSDHCDEYIAKNEPGNATCIIAFNLK